MAVHIICAYHNLLDCCAIIFLIILLSLNKNHVNVLSVAPEPAVLDRLYEDNDTATSNATFWNQ